MSYLQAQIASLLRIAAVIEPIEPYYEVLEYIELDGTQYFDTGIQTSDNLSFECGFKLNSGGSASMGIFGGRHNTGRTQSTNTVWSGYELRRINSSSFTQVINRTQTGQVTTSQTIAFNTDYAFSFKGTKLRLNNTDYTITQGTAIENPVNIYLGAINNDGSPVVPITGNIKYFKIYDNGTLIKDFIPVLDSQMRPCLYDKVEKTFLYAKNVSDGTTTYDLGFKRWNKFDVDYIENTGTSYIAFSDITPSTTMGMNIEYAYTTLSSSEPAGVIGTYNGDTQRKDTFFVSTSSGYTQKASSPSSASCGVMVFHRGGNVGTSSSSSASYIEPEKDVWYQATVNWLGDGEIYWTNGITDLQASVGENAVMTNGLRLFSRCNSSNNTYNNCKSRVRKLQFSDGSTIIRDYQPVVWHSNNTTAIATLYDKVYNKMLTPTGSLKAYITNVNTTKTDVFTTTGATSGKAINAEGQIINSSASSYSALLPIVGGSVIECVSGNTGNNNYRYHCYDSSGNWIEQSLVLYPEGAGTVEHVTGSFTAPLNAKYVRVSYATQASGAIQVKSEIETTYEVGKSVSGTPSSSVSGASNCFDTGLYGTQDTTVKYIGVAYDSDSTSGQLFGSYDGTLSTSQNLTINSTGSSGNTSPIRFDGKVITTPIRIAIDKSVSIVNSKYGLWVNDSLHGSWGSVNDFTTTTTMLILKCNNSTNTRNNGCGYCLILDKDETVAEYIPVKNGSTIGLYDTVSKTVNTGVGTINFNVLD